MKFTTKGITKTNRKISDLIKYFNSISESTLFIYQGMIVEIDPTIDYSDENVLIRWSNITEGFNDKIIYYNLVEFKKDFKLVNA